MFTGIIEEIGQIAKIESCNNGYKLRINCQKVLGDISLGDSIAVNGICLTVTSFDTHSFTADVMHETKNRTSLSTLGTGSQVNLERAMAANGRFGGHIVSGHIDGVGRIKSIEKDGNSLWYKVDTPKEILELIVEKGSIAIDGISLTVAKVDRENFSVSVIPHTMGETILKGKKVNDIVNLENDVIGKYVQKLMNHHDKQDITREFLLKHGF